MISIYSKPNYDEKAIFIVPEWLSPIVYSDGGEFKIDKTIYSPDEWEEKKQQLHLLWCEKLIQYKDAENDDYILGSFTDEGLQKIREQINV